MVKAVKQLCAVLRTEEEEEAEVQLLQRGILLNHLDRCASLWGYG